MKKNRAISVLGDVYLHKLIPDLFVDSFRIYLDNKPNKNNFQVAPLEYRSCTTAIILIALIFESYRNRIFYVDLKWSKDNPLLRPNIVHSDFNRVLNKYKCSVNVAIIEQVIGELFSVRDAIIHNHIYDIEYFTDEKWNVVKKRQKILKDFYKNDYKRKAYVNGNFRTKMLGLNVQPILIGFENLFICLVLLDLFQDIFLKVLPRGYLGGSLFYYKGETKFTSLSDFLRHYYRKIPDKRLKGTLIFKKSLNQISSEFDGFFKKSRNSFIAQRCIDQECKEFGFGKNLKCKKCDYSLFKEQSFTI